MIALPYRVEPLGDHDRATFSCGKPSLDRYIREVAGQDQREDLSRCFVLIEETLPRRILGYYTLSNSSIAPQAGPPRTQKVRRYAEVGAVLLGRFALDVSQQGRGLGRRLLIHILMHVSRLGEESGFQLLLVDPLDDEAAAFYGSFGFTPLPTETRMYMLLKDLRATLNSIG